MGFSGAVQLWEEWQLRILVSGSLCVQCYLSLFACSRKKQIRPLNRLLIWLAYLSGDALAIYALATLFNRQRKAGQEPVSSSRGDVNESRDLELLWAPVLLMHLGGQINISAYNIEDNELWRRHILTAVSQVAVVVYVFCKSWTSSAEKRLLAAAILLFSIGIFKCFNKPLALERASFNSIVTTFHPAPRTKIVNREVRLEEYIQEARSFVQQNKNPPALDSAGQSSHKKLLYMVDKLFVDYAYVYKRRLTTLKSFWLLREETTYKALRVGLSETFDLIYSKIPVHGDKNRTVPQWGNDLSVLIFLLNLVLPIVPIGLFHSSHKNAYRGSDIKITFILLYITYFLEISSYFAWKWQHLDEWSDGIAQRSLVGLLAWNRRHARLMGIAEFLQCKGLVDTYFGLMPCHSSRDITMSVREHAKGGWMNHITDVESYWRFSDSRVQWALERNGREVLLGSIQKALDESVILWHVATDFCFYYSKGTSPDSDCARMCRQISNYMMHLLFANPEMLLPGSRRNLFTVAYDELEAILHGDDDLAPLDERALTLRIINKAESAKGFIRHSWFLAQELMRFGDDIKMWEIIKGVWIEMLCFSATRCRGYLHAKSLGSGGEFLTYISLLMSHAGLETYAERQQRVQLRLPKEARQHIVRIKAMKREIQEAASNMERKIMERAASASAEVEIVIS